MTKSVSVAATEQPHNSPWLLYARKFTEQGASALDFSPNLPHNPLIKGIILSDTTSHTVPNAFFSLAWNSSYSTIEIRMLPSIWDACQETHDSLMASECTAILSTLLAHESIHAIEGQNSTGKLLDKQKMNIKTRPWLMHDYTHTADKITTMKLPHNNSQHRLVRLEKETYPFKLEEIDPHIVRYMFAKLLFPFFQDEVVWTRYWNIIQKYGELLPPLARIKLQQTRILLGRPNLAFADVVPYYDLYLHNKEELKGRIKTAGPYFFIAAAHILEAIRLRR